MARMVITLLIVLITANASAQVICSVSVNDGLGDEVNGRLNMSGYGSHGSFSFVVESDGGERLNLSQTGPLSWTFGYFAIAGPEWIVARVIRGNPAPATCTIQASVIPYTYGTPIPQALKDVLKPQLADTNSWLARMAYGGVLCSWPIAAIAPIQVNVCFTAAVVASILQWHAYSLERTIGDPPDPANCTVPADLYIPGPTEIGLSYTSDDPFGDGVVPTALNAVVFYTTQLSGISNYIYDSANRASGCLEIGNPDGARWQSDNARTAIQWYADNADAAGGYLDALANEFGAYWNPVLVPGGREDGSDLWLTNFFLTSEVILRQMRAGL